MVTCLPNRASCQLLHCYRYDRLLAVREEVSLGLDRRVEEELQRLKEKARLDVQSAQAHARELFERENLALREARDTAREDAERQTVALKQANAANSQLEIDYRTLTATTEAQLSELRNRLKMKSFEHERVAVELEEIKAVHRQSALEAERWQKKCALLKEEYYTLKTESATRVTELQAQLSNSSKQLEHYELIEAELDSAIVAGKAGRALEAGSTMATSAQRRVKQALGLAQQVTALQTEQKELVAKLAAAQSRNRKMEEAQAGTGMGVGDEQPFGMLASRLDQKDEQIVELRARVETAEAEATVARQQLAAATAREREVTADIERLLRNRSEVASLREDMERAMQGTSEGARSFSMARPTPSMQFVRRDVPAETPEPTGLEMAPSH
eukprot:SAG25_NODE_534_length_7139_cov_17.597443_4_plen_388_part_00